MTCESDEPVSDSDEEATEDLDDEQAQETFTPLYSLLTSLQAATARNADTRAPGSEEPALNPEESQMYAIAWMEHQIKLGYSSGIIADEVGLGKVTSLMV